MFQQLSTPRKPSPSVTSTCRAKHLDGSVAEWLVCGAVLVVVVVVVVVVLLLLLLRACMLATQFGNVKYIWN